MDKISIIVPVYNAQKYLKKCINSIINQTYKNIEILLINDGSIDNSLEICKEYEKKDSRIIVINKKNKGVSNTRNVGIKKSTGDYIVFIDSDDWFELDAIETMYNIIKEKNLDMVRFNYQINGKPQTSYTNVTDFEKNILNGNIPAYVCIFIFKKQFIKNILFKEDISMMEDTTFIVELLEKKPKLLLSDKVIYNYYLREDSLSRGKKNYKKNIKDILKVNKYINEILKHNDLKIIANTKHVQLINEYLLKMHRDGFDINEISDCYNNLLNNKYYIKIFNDLNESYLEKRDINIYKYIQKNQFDKLIKYFIKEEKKGVLEYKINRIKNRLKGLVK
ncbi:MAG: glycosyltransferase family 2 protein [Bacilli bacterium]|nr:glycosyltransferase family 2 protein [Bacilli bacterium]